MNQPASDTLTQTIDAIYQNESRRIFATLVRLLGDFDLAEDALHEAFRAAIEQWPREGVPAKPRAWLVSVGRFKAIDSARRKGKFEAPLDEDGQHANLPAQGLSEEDPPDIPDDRLRLIFTCCHPSLPADARVALTLREVCGLTTEAIAHSFLTSPAALAQRIVRAKSRIRAEAIPYQVPQTQELPERLHAVLQVIYLIFNEGYSVSSGETLTRPDLSGEAIRLGRLLVDLLPDGEAQGLLALMLLLESRRPARTSSQGDLIPLEEQDRTLWDQERIAEGSALAQKVFLTRQVGPYTLQAAIAALHAAAPSLAATDWPQIVGLYDLLLQLVPSPVIEINRAVAVSMRDGPAAGLDLVEAILARGDLSNYHLAYAARAELFRRLGRSSEARASYQQALTLSEQVPERRFLEKRLASLQN